MVGEEGYSQMSKVQAKKQLESTLGWDCIAPANIRGLRGRLPGSLLLMVPSVHPGRALGEVAGERESM